MVSRSKAQRFLSENAKASNMLSDLLGTQKKISGEVALKYLVDNGISRQIAEEVIQRSADEDLSVAGPPTGTEPTIVKDEDAEKEPHVRPEGKVVSKLDFKKADENAIQIDGDIELKGAEVTLSGDDGDLYLENSKGKWKVSTEKVAKIATEVKNNDEKNVYKAPKGKENRLMTNEEDPKNDKKAEEQDPEEDKKEEGTEQEPHIKDDGAAKGTQADGVHTDGGGGNCPEGQSWDAETETCKPVEDKGSITPEAPDVVQDSTSLSDGGKASGETYRRGSNADIKAEKKRVVEYYKKLDRLEALRGLKLADARISAKEKYLKEKELDSLIKRAKENAKPIASIVSKSDQRTGETIGKKVSATEAETRGPTAWLRAVAREQNVPSSYVWHVNKENAFGNNEQRFLKSFDAQDNTVYKPMEGTQKKAGEALSVTGPPTGDFMRIMSEQVLVLPDGKVVTPVRQFCETKILPPGVREAFFYDFGAVTFTAVTEDASTEVGTSTPIVRSAGGNATPRGTQLKLGYTQLEEAPIDIVAAANRSFALESVNDESAEIIDRTYNDDTAGSGTATVRKAKGAGVKTDRWVDHAGTQITADAAGLANLTFAGLVAAKGVIEDEGLDPSNIITYTTGKAIRDLIFDPDLDSFISFSRPAIITEATVERIAGTNVVRSSAPPAGTQTGSFRSAMFIPNIAFGLISGRDLTMEAQRRNELQAVFLTGTQRIEGRVKNVEATCRISHL